MGQIIVSIGREFGSGGHEIAERLAERLGIDLYDYNFMHEIAAEKNVEIDELERYDEVPKNKLFSRTVRGYNSSPEQNVADMQFEYLQKKAEEGKSFVIVGRCAETVLKGNPNLISIFILGDFEVKTERIMRLYRIYRDEAISMIKRRDKKRKTYHNYYCTGKWGDSRNYDLSINSSKLSMDQILDMLESYIAARCANKEEGKTVSD